MWITTISSALAMEKVLAPSGMHEQSCLRVGSTCISMDNEDLDQHIKLTLRSKKRIMTQVKLRFVFYKCSVESAHMHRLDRDFADRIHRVRMHMKGSDQNLDLYLRWIRQHVRFWSYLSICDKYLTLMCWPIYDATRK